MNLFKDSIFSRKSKRKHDDYDFHLANTTINDPLLYSFENNDIELGILESDHDGSGDDDDEKSRSKPVRTRHLRSEMPSSVHNTGSVVIVEKPILPNETIQAFAIRYRVPISQLKRINNLQHDQEFHALTHCRVPVQRFGVHHDITPTTNTLVDFSEHSTLSSLPVTHLSQQNHHAFLKAMDQDLAVMRTKVEQLIETPTPVLSTTAALTGERLQPVVKPSNDLRCDGADCGFRSWHIVLLLILIVLIPLVCVYFYIKSQPK